MSVPPLWRPVSPEGIVAARGAGKVFIEQYGSDMSLWGRVEVERFLTNIVDSYLRAVDVPEEGPF